MLQQVKILCFVAAGFAASSSAATPAGPWTQAAEELITLVEKADPQTKDNAAAWQNLQQSLRTAAQQAASAQGFRLSASHLLAAWPGRGFRLLDDTQAQFYARSTDAPVLREVGAWFVSKGAKWYVKQLGPSAPATLHRGDAIVMPEFHPVQSWSKAGAQSIKVQSQPLGTPQDMKLQVRETTLANWALQQSQAASTSLPSGGKRICIEKGWLWLTPAVTTFLQSKIVFAQETCDALLVDLRDSFGEFKLSGTLKGKRRIPSVVLVNQESREAAVALALRIKEDLSATVMGEPTASKLPVLEVVPLKVMPLLLQVYASNSGSLLPDEKVNDSWMFAAGTDPIFEAGIAALQKSLK